MTDREKLIQLISEIVVPYFAEQIADHLLANGATFATDTNVGSKWIPVTERLPEHTGSYIVCTDNGAVCTARFYFDLPMGLRYEEPHWNNCHMRRHITHWMPLPEPPEDGGAENA